MLELMPLVQGWPALQADAKRGVRRGRGVVSDRLTLLQVGQHLISIRLHRVDADVKRGSRVKRLRQRIKRRQMMQARVQPVRQTVFHLGRHRVGIHHQDPGQPILLSRRDLLQHPGSAHGVRQALDGKTPSGRPHSALGKLAVLAQVAQHVEHRLCHLGTVA